MRNQCEEVDSIDLGQATAVRTGDHPATVNTCFARTGHETDQAVDRWFEAEIRPWYSAAAGRQPVGNSRCFTRSPLPTLVSSSRLPRAIQRFSRRPSDASDWYPRHDCHRWASWFFDLKFIDLNRVSRAPLRFAARCRQGTTRCVPATRPTLRSRRSLRFSASQPPRRPPSGLLRPGRRLLDLLERATTRTPWGAIRPIGSRVTTILRAPAAIGSWRFFRRWVRKNPSPPAGQIAGIIENLGSGGQDRRNPRFSNLL